MLLELVERRRNWPEKSQSQALFVVLLRNQANPLPAPVQEQELYEWVQVRIYELEVTVFLV